MVEVVMRHIRADILGPKQGRRRCPEWAQAREIIVELVPRSEQQHALLLLQPAPTRTGERDERIDVSVLEPNRKRSPVAQYLVWCGRRSDVRGNAHANR